MDHPLTLLREATQRSSTRTTQTRLFRILQTLEHSPTVTYILDANLRFIYCNPAWNRFALSNGAPQLAGDAIIGSELFHWIPNVLRNVYETAFLQALKSRKIWECSYDCSSPDLFRKYKMRIHYLESWNWFLVTNPPVVEKPHKKITNPRQNVYFDRGIITLCAHCRCSKRMDTPDQWDFVPEYLSLKGLDLLMISHGLCSLCHAYFYPDLALASAAQ